MLEERVRLTFFCCIIADLWNERGVFVEVNFVSALYCSSCVLWNIGGVAY